MTMVITIGLLTMTFDRSSEIPSERVTQSHVSPYALRFDFLSPFADKLDEEIEERAQQPSEDEEPWKPGR